MTDAAQTPRSDGPGKRPDGGVHLALLTRVVAAMRSDRWLDRFSVLGYLLAALVFIYWARPDGGWLAYDADAYWLGGRHVLDGVALYVPSTVAQYEAYKYPPLFAQLAAPFALLPQKVFSLGWLLICLLSLRPLAGSWRNVGLWFLFPPVLLELRLANVTLPLAAGVFLALRGGRLASASLPLLTLLKFGPVFAIPFLWRWRPGLRRAMVTGAIVTGAACLASYMLDPGAWSLYLQSFGWQTNLALDVRGVIAIAPVLWADAAVRVALATVLMAYGLRTGSARGPYVASLIAIPVLAVWRLAPLPAVLRLPGREVRDVT